MKNRIYLLTLLIIAWISLIGKENPKQVFYPQTQSNVLAECVRPVAQINLQANNVRARLLTNANYFSEGQYIFPKPATGQVPVSAIYTSSLWMGGLDRARNIKLSAGTYQSTGYDYFSGPLDLNGLTEAEICKNWDRLFSVNGDVIKKHFNDLQSAQNAGIPYNCDNIPDEIKYWPARGNPFWGEKYNFSLPDQSLAPFWDEDTDGFYNPCNGDFPILDIEKCEPHNAFEALNRVPTQHVFSIINDAGGPQTLSGINSTQMEIKVSSFAYNTNDELNNVTFHQYKFTFLGGELLTDFHLGMYVDPDLGCYLDDFVGYDKDKRMAYIYNQDALDGINGGTSCNGTTTYGNKIPMLGFDIHKNISIAKRFKRDSNGQVILDNAGNIILENPDHVNSQMDTVIEAQIGSFIHIENGGVGNPPPATTDPQRGREDEFYNYLRGFWSDGTPLTFGGTGYTPGSTDSVRYAFPDDPSDPTGWSMCNVSAMNGGDRKFMVSSESHTIIPGTITSMLLGIVGVLDIIHPCPDLATLRFADDKAQHLFDNCFELINSTEDVKEIDLFKDVYIYPNPTLLSNNILQIANLPTNTAVSIMSIKGQILHQFKEDDTVFYGPYQAVKSFEYATNSLSSGMYIIQILDKKTGTVKSLKWIVL